MWVPDELALRLSGAGDTWCRSSVKPSAHNCSSWPVSSNQPPWCCSWWSRLPAVWAQNRSQPPGNPGHAPRCEQEREAGPPTIRSRTQRQRNTRAKQGEARGTARPHDESRNDQARESSDESSSRVNKLRQLFLYLSLPIRSLHAHESLWLPTEPLIGPPSAALRQWSSRGRSHPQHRSVASRQADRKY